MAARVAPSLLTAWPPTFKTLDGTVSNRADIRASVTSLALRSFLFICQKPFACPMDENEKKKKWKKKGQTHGNSTLQQQQQPIVPATGHQVTKRNLHIFLTVLPQSILPIDTTRQVLDWQSTKNNWTTHPTVLVQRPPKLSDKILLHTQNT